MTAIEPIASTGPAASAGPRVLIYSHDSFGLGHLRRCREIAHALVSAHADMSVLILSGSPIIGSFDFRSRVDFVRVPGVIKLRNGEYTSLNLPLALDQTLAIRASIIKHTADIFAPDLFLVDKEPLGLRGEIEDTLVMLKSRGVPLILGLRDVMDEPDLLQPEWERKNVVPALENLYDEIWIYGLKDIHDPLAGMPVSDAIRRKRKFTGYLRRGLPETAQMEAEVPVPDGPFLLVTPGGGGDGDGLVDWVLRAYEAEPRLPWPAVIALGPFMQPDRKAAFQQRASTLKNVDTFTFTAHFEHLIARATAVVAMGGYNTFCEILSFDKRALIVPRTRPRREQYIRATRAQELGLLTVLEDDGNRSAARMVEALRQLPNQRQPSDGIASGFLDGLPAVNRLVDGWLDHRASHEKPRLGMIDGGS